MSTGANVVLLPTRGRPGAEPPGRALARPGRPLVRLAAFTALGLYGVLRWGTLLSAGSRGRLLALLGLAMLVAGTGGLLARRSRILPVAAALLALLAALAIAGLPVSWIVHLRVARSARAIGDGLSGLPGVLVPYIGSNRWVRMVIVLGAAVLLLDAALLLAFAPRGIGELRRAAAALPLVALAAVPTALITPKLPYLEGLFVFVLLATFVWCERIDRDHAGAAIGLCALALIIAMLVAPALDRHQPLFDYRDLGATVVPARVDLFDWSQNYGPVDWPRHGRAVLEVGANQPEYWKAEDLDVFDGAGWEEGVIAGTPPSPSAGSLAHWSETIDVTVREMQSSEVIGSGVSSHPVGLPQPVVEGPSPGTWIAGKTLGPGDSYQIRVYSPNPSAAQLESAGDDYSAVPSGYRTIELPSVNQAQPEVMFPAFHSPAPIVNVIGLPVGTGSSLIEQSPYARVYALARRLSSAAPTPYAYARSIERLLASGYTYNEDPPPSRYPLETFLLSSRIGYCQQFAGAMALLLRMGGVPARVSVGFTPGTYDNVIGRWVVTDEDAHAWVEAWFPTYGWVRFEPTPPADPALGTHAALPDLGGSGGPTPKVSSGNPTGVRLASAAGARATGAGHSAVVHVPVFAVAAVLLAGLLATGILLTRPPKTDERRIAELERAFARTGRPLAGGVTLAALEHRLRGSAGAAGYVRSLRERRFGAAGDPPTRGQRRSLRTELAAGLGATGRLRALWALPPRRRP